MRENGMFEVKAENLSRICENYRFGLQERILA
jgi:hypothetical protein